MLVVEDDDEIRLALIDALSELGHEVLAESRAEPALQALEQGDVNLVLTDFRMPGMDGIELCAHLASEWPNLPVVVMTAFGDLDAAVGALRAGAFDFIPKPFAIERLISVVGRALDHGPSSVSRLALRNAADEALHGLIGSSTVMRGLREQIGRAALVDANVLITGESGTGKELVARAIHQGGPRAAGPFVAVSCAAVPHEILEAELFGHTRGAFTGAAQSRVGLFQQASGGTLFLDEIGDMPLDLQPKLLRALQERSVRPLGASREITADVRILSATNRDLGTAVRAGSFREDLLFRLKVLHLELPPLRVRERDVIELAQHFLGEASRVGRAYQLSREAETPLLSYRWPGNVRELENCMSAAMALAPEGQIGFDELPTRVRSQRATPSTPSEPPASLEEVERRHIELVLRAVGWNKARAARKLGIDRATLYRKLARFGLERPPE
ncbi:MAG TPA: sigma-54 dependent transcriptional regulator [Polyangiaceae bacterium]